MEPVCGVSRGKIGKAATEKSYYQNRAGHGAGYCNGDVLAGNRVYLLLYTIYIA
jgi:hypothetical protein